MHYVVALWIIKVAGAWGIYSIKGNAMKFMLYPNGSDI